MNLQRGKYYKHKYVGSGSRPEIQVYLGDLGLSYLSTGKVHLNKMYFNSFCEGTHEWLFWDSDGMVSRSAELEYTMISFTEVLISFTEVRKPTKKPNKLKQFALALERGVFLEGVAGLADFTWDAKKWYPLEQQIGYQIGDHNIPAAWKESQGAGITVAVLDTGCDMKHEDLAGQVVAGYDFNGDTPEVIDSHGHGSHCAGIIAASNNNIGMVGVAPKAKVMVIKVLGRGGRGSMSDVARGINFAIEKGVDVISMSLGSPTSSNAVHAAIKAAYKKGIPVICAAGNSGDIGRLDYPGRYPETISIGALNDKKKRTSWSQTGPNLDFMAPGAEIYSTVPGNHYAKMSGTSMATPWAAGVVALMLAERKASYSRFGYFSLSVEDIRTKLKETAIDMDKVGKDNKTGWGLINVEKAVATQMTLKVEHGVDDGVYYEGVGSYRNSRPAVLLEFGSTYSTVAHSHEQAIQKVFGSHVAGMILKKANGDKDMPPYGWKYNPPLKGTVIGTIKHKAFGGNLLIFKTVDSASCHIYCIADERAIQYC